MEYDFQILKLTSAFYQRYPHELYPEFLLKQQRAYNCLLLEIWDDMFVCIPFRSEIHHQNGYYFSGTIRSKSHHSGLDYSKLVIVNQSSYIDSKTAVVDSDEYHECVKNLDRIVNEVSSYVQDYIDYRKGKIKLHPREFQRRYKYSTLKYFEKELGIS